MKQIIIVLCLLFAAEGYASGRCKELPPIDDYVCNAQSAFTMRGMEARLVVLGGKTLEELASGLKADREAIKPLYQAAMQVVGDDDEARRAIREFQAYWLSSLDVLTAFDQPRFAYRKRVADHESGLNEKGYLLKTFAP